MLVKLTLGYLGGLDPTGAHEGVAEDPLVAKDPVAGVLPIIQEFSSAVFLLDVYRHFQFFSLLKIQIESLNWRLVKTHRFHFQYIGE
jgi:hypothetical protein